jgi:O-antigen/teichoic acid export membrane protein
MAERINWDIVFSFTSWLIVIALLYGVANLLLVPPTGAGPIAHLIGIEPARFAYIALYLVEGLALGYAKWKKRDRMRKIVLAVIYSTGLFTSVLGIALGGFHNFAIAPKLVGNLVITAAAAFCWLYWTLKKYYVRYEELETFDEEDV